MRSHILLAALSTVSVLTVSSAAAGDRHTSSTFELSETSASRAVAVSGTTPVLNQPSAMTLAGSTSADQTLYGTDVDGDPLSFSKSFGPSYMSVTTTDPGNGSALGNIHLAPALADVGTSTGSVVVSDGVLVDQKSFAIVVFLPHCEQDQAVFDATVGGLLLGCCSDQKLAQVVTACISGALAEIDVPVACSYGNLVVEIQGTSNGMPNGVVLASRSIPASILPSFYPAQPEHRPVAFSAPASLSAGDQFAIVLRSDGECGIFQGPLGNPYPGGDGFFDARPNPAGVWLPLSDRADLPFKVGIVPPESPNSAPVADAGGPYSGVVGDPIHFDGTGSFDPDGAPLMFRWAFGDGLIAAGAEPTHAYIAAGTYTVGLTVTDDGTPALANIAAATVTVADVGDRAPNADAGGSYAGVAGIAIHFDGSRSFDPDGDLLAFDWDFGDGATGAGVLVDHTYATPGTYAVSLLVTDTGSPPLTATSSTTATITIPALTIGFEAPQLDRFPGRLTINPYQDQATGVVFSGLPYGDSNTEVGLVTNEMTSVCVPGDPLDQKLGSAPLGYDIGLSNFPIRADFGLPLSPPCTVSVEFQTGAGGSIRLRLFDEGGNVVGATSGVAGPALEPCVIGRVSPAVQRLTATSQQPVSYAVMDGPGSSYVCVIDDFTYSSNDLVVRLDLDPNVINLASRAPWVTAYIEPTGFDLTNIDISALRLAGSVAAESKYMIVGDHDANGVPDLMVKFSRATLDPLLQLGVNELEVTGSLRTGESFKGTDEVTMIEPTGGPVAASVAPNPLNPAGILRFETLRPGKTRVTLYDLHGRVVRTLMEAPFISAGPHQVTIDGRDERGEALASGVYFYRIEASEGSIEGRVVVLK